MNSQGITLPRRTSPCSPVAVSRVSRIDGMHRGIGAPPGRTRRSYFLPPMMRNSLVPQSGHTPCMAGRPFFMVTSCALAISFFALHFTQYASATVVSLPWFDFHTENLGRIVPAPPEAVKVQNGPGTPASRPPLRLRAHPASPQHPQLLPPRPRGQLRKPGQSHPPAATPSSPPPRRRPTNLPLTLAPASPTTINAVSTTVDGSGTSIAIVI